MANIKYPGYHPGNSILHAMKTEGKVLLALIFVFVSGTGGGFTLLTIAFLCHLGMLVSGISISDGWRRLVVLKFFLLILGGMPLFLTPGTPVRLFDGFILPITIEGFECSVFSVSRLVLMIWISMILVWTTSPESLMRVVSELGSRLLPKSMVLQEFVLVGVMAFQTLPYLLAEAEEEIGKSWKKGGKHPNQRSVFKTAKEMVRSMIGWTVTILATPDRLVIKKNFN